MARKIEKMTITGLDIGTSKVVALIAEVLPDGTLEVIGIGRAPSRGLKRGVVVDIEATVQSISRAVQAAELKSGQEVHAVYAGISGSHISSLNSHGIVAIKNQEVSALDVDRVIEAAKAVVIPASQKILHILPQEYMIDNQGNIREPIGMAGVRLEARVHVVTGAVSAAQNIVKCIRRCGLEVRDVILEQLASSHSVLTEDEKELGVCLIDIGAGTTDLAIFVNGAIQYTAVIPIAGEQVTNDIAMALRTPTKAAETIKVMSAAALPSLSDPNEMIEVTGVSSERPGRRISQRILSEVVFARYEELFALVKHELSQSGFEHRIAAGIVLTGGGSNIQGAVELAEQCFEMPVRQGFPHCVSGLSEVMTDPSLSTGVGLLLYGYEQQYGNQLAKPMLSDTAKGVWTRMRQWFQGHF